MTSFLIDRNSPIRTVGDQSGTGLHHRSRHSTESENGSPHHHPHSSSSQQRQQSYNEDVKEEPSSKDEKSKDKKGSPSMFSYFKSELTRSYKLEADASEFVQRRDRIYVSVNTPKNLEKFCAFGLLQCLDSFLFIMTFLPLRILVAIMNVLTYPCSVIFFRKKAILNPAQICDILKGVILVVSCFITSYIDTSMVYHIVRTQSTIKFYVIYNMLDVMDKLISGFGQDVLDSLYWTAVEPRGRKREHFGTIFHLMFAIAYIVIHTALILIQAITLNVAFNSHNKSLLTIMLSNNFIEIKSNLFKRLDKNTLCQITYVDVKERFHYFVLLLFILIHNLLEKNWLRDQASIFFTDALIVLVTEVVVDWIKHSFINKINEFSATYYGDFAIGLAQDIASGQKKHALTDFSDQVCRRMGFTPIPLTCLLYMVCRKSFEITGVMSWCMIFMLFLCLFTTKVLNSIVLLGWAQYLITQGNKSKSSVIVGNSQVFPKKNENVEKKRVKTESISHCPDMTGHLPHSLLTPKKSDIDIVSDSKLYSQTSPISTGSLNIQTEIFPASTEFETPSAEKSKSEKNGNQFAEYNLEFQPPPDVTAADSLHQKRESNNTSFEKKMVDSEALNKALNEVLGKVEVRETFDNPVQDSSNETCDMQLQDISDSTLSLIYESETSSISMSSEASSSRLEPMSLLSPTTDPAFIVGSSDKVNEERNNKALFVKSASFPPTSQSVPAENSPASKMTDNVDISCSHDVHLFAKEEAGDSSVEKTPDLYS